jgi:hypothetical protein
VIFSLYSANCHSTKQPPLLESGYERTNFVGNSSFSEKMARCLLLGMKVSTKFWNKFSAKLWTVSSSILFKSTKLNWDDVKIQILTGWMVYNYFQQCLKITHNWSYSNLGIFFTHALYFSKRGFGKCVDFVESHEMSS